MAENGVFGAKNCPFCTHKNLPFLQCLDKFKQKRAQKNKNMAKKAFLAQKRDILTQKNDIKGQIRFSIKLILLQ